MSSELHPCSVSLAKARLRNSELFMPETLLFCVPQCHESLLCIWLYIFIYPIYSNFVGLSIWFIICRQFYKCLCHFSGIDSLLGTFPVAEISHWLRPPLFVHRPNHLNVQYLIRKAFLSFICRATWKCALHNWMKRRKENRGQAMENKAASLSLWIVLLNKTEFSFQVHLPGLFSLFLFFFSFFFFFPIHWNSASSLEWEKNVLSASQYGYSYSEEMSGTNPLRILICWVN